jgi:outer membrane receptor for ferrienterochelin and colicin
MDCLLTEMKGGENEIAMSLTDEDKNWFLNTFATKQDLERSATKQDLERVETWLLKTFATKQDVERVETWLLNTFATKQDVAQYATKQDLERVETSLLTAFHQWASPVEMRQRSHAAAIRALDAEVEAISDRVNKLEDRP